MEIGREKTALRLAFILVGIAYAFVGIVAAHPFDDAIYAFNSQTFYFLSGSPFIYLPMGTFLDAINVAGYFPIALLSSYFSTNVLLLQLGVKIPFIIFTFLLAYVLYRISRVLKFSGAYASLLLLTSPIYFFTSVIYGSALVVSVFFLISGLYFILRQRTIAAAIMYGISTGMYLYPVFGIPIFMRYISVVKGKKSDALIFLGVSSLFAALGQLIIFFLFLKSGHLSLSPNNPYGYLSPYSSVPYYDIFDFLNVFGKGNLVPGQLYNVLYYGSSIIFSLSYFLVKREKVNDETLIVFLLVQGVLFGALAPYNLPSYMSAMIPLAIILGLLLRRWVYIGIMWVSSFFSFLVMQTITHVGFIVYFSDLNMKILTTNIYPWSSYPPWINGISGSLYVVSLLSFIPLALLRKKGNVTRLWKSLIAQSATVGALVVVGILLLAPVASSLPQSMYLSHSIDSFTGYASPVYVTGTSLVATYDFPILGSMSQSGIDHFLGRIEFPDTFTKDYYLSGNKTGGPGSYTQDIALPYPLENGSLQLYTSGSGAVSIMLKNSTSSSIPRQSTYQYGNETILSYNINSYLSGEYIMIANSSVPILLHNSTSLALSITGIPAYGIVSINGRTISNGTVTPDQLGGTVIVKYGGPFYGIPAQIPSILVEMVKPLGKPVGSQLAIGGLAFFALIVCPPFSIFFLIRRRRGIDREEQREQ